MNIFSIKDICKIGSSKRIFANEYTKKGIPFFRSTEIIGLANQKNFVPDYYISENKFNEISQKFPVPQNNDILIAAIGANMGTAYFVNINYKFYFKDGNVIWLREFKNSVNPKYLYYWLTTQKGYKELCNTAIGSAQKALTIDKVGNIKFNVPNIDFQQHIVDIIVHLIYYQSFYLKLHFLLIIFLTHLKLLLFFPLFLPESFRQNHQYQHIGQ